MGVKVREKVAGSGVWWVFIANNGTRSSKRVGSEKAARKVAEMIQARLKLGQDAVPKEKPEVPTLDEYYKKFKRFYLSTAVRQSTLESYETSFNLHILPSLGALRLDGISRERVKEFVAELSEKKFVRKVKVERPAGTATAASPTEKFEIVERKLSRPTIRIITAELSALLNHAREDGIISENSATRLGKHYKKAHVVHSEIEPLTVEEVQIFLAAVLESSAEYFPLFLCALHTGLRSGELAGLQWGDIDFNGKFLTVRRNVVNGRVHPTKTDKTRRVDLSDTLLETLEALRRKRKEQWLAKGHNEVPEWVFGNQQGNAAEMHNIKNRHFYKCLEKAKLRRIRFHDLRHTFASLLIQNGESLAYVKEQLGHSSIKMTVDVYGHLVPGANRQAVNRLPGLEPAFEKATSGAAVVR